MRIKKTINFLPPPPTIPYLRFVSCLQFTPMSREGEARDGS